MCTSLLRSRTMSIQSVETLNRRPGFSLGDAPRFREGISQLQSSEPVRTFGGSDESRFMQTAEDGSGRVHGTASGWPN